MTHPLASKTASKAIVPKRIDCLFDDGTRQGPFRLLSTIGPHAIIALADGTPIPLPARSMVAPKRAARRVSSESGERTRARG